MKAKRILLLPLLLALIIAAVGCAEEAKISEEELIEGAIAAARDIETYQFDMNTGTDMSGEMGDEEIEAGHSSIEDAGVVDNINRRIQIETSTEHELPPEGAIERHSRATYLIGDVIYIKQPIPGVEWTKREMRGLWDREDQMRQQVELFKASEIDRIDTETINGIPCYAVELIPSLEKLWEIMRPTEFEAEPLDLEQVFKSVSLNQWYAEGSFLPVKAQLEVTMLLGSENFDLPEDTMMVTGEITYNLARIVVFHHYNEAVSIELPPEAESVAG